MNAADRDVERLVERVPEGWTRVAYEDRTYGLSRTTGVNGRSIKILARELGGDDLISANIYATPSNGHQLRACEMPDQKVLDFLRGWTQLDDLVQNRVMVRAPRTRATKPGLRGEGMPNGEESRVQNGARIEPGAVRDAVTRAPFVYADGATQVFTEDGRTTFTEKGRSSTGEWGVDDDGRFWSFWPPSYRAVYDVTWIANGEGEAVGVSFTDVKNADAFEGRYRAGVAPT